LNHAIFVTLSSLVLCASALAADAPKANWPAPKPPADMSAFGTGIQRTMTLLATSTPEHRHTVKVLFYGQSITEQGWWKIVADDLRARFPNADLVIENRAIGGFASQLLVKTAEADLYPFYPDLMIFYVYGSHIDYESIIKRTRERTTAEILMQNDHVTNDKDFDELTDRAQIRPDGKMWNSFMNFVFLPDTAKKYGCELCDERAEWKAYLKENKLAPKDLLRDGVHLNDHGCYLMAEFVKERLRYLPKAPQDAWKDLVRTYEVGKDVKWEGGTLALDVDGNRIDLLAAKGDGKAAPAKVLIDGKKPSEFPGCYAATRTTAYPQSSWPCLKRVMAEKPLVLEDWTVRLKDVSDDGKQAKFEVIGSKTGPDGEGTAAEKFVSKSGRVVIEPDDWNLAFCRDVFKRPLPQGFEVKWKIVPMFVDEYAAPEVKDETKETVVTIAQGLPNGRHTLKVLAEAGGQPAIRAVRVYRPPVK